MFLTRTTAVRRAAAAVQLAAAGCEAQPRDPAGGEPAAAAHPADATHSPVPQAQAARPDPARMGYDAGSRELTLYDLDDRAARWVVSLPMERRDVPVGGRYQFPPGVEVDPDQVAVYYTAPNHLASPAVTLQEVLDAASARAGR